MRTAGVSVLTAGTTVVIGMLGLLVLRQSLLNGVAVAAAATVAMTVLGALTLLPALLGLHRDAAGKATVLEGGGAAGSARDGTRGGRSRSRTMGRVHPAAAGDGRACPPTGVHRCCSPRRCSRMKLASRTSRRRRGARWATRATRRWRAGSGPGSTRR